MCESTPPFRLQNLIYNSKLILRLIVSQQFSCRDLLLELYVIYQHQSYSAYYFLLHSEYGLALDSFPRLPPPKNLQTPNSKIPYHLLDFSRQKNPSPDDRARKGTNTPARKLIPSIKSKSSRSRRHPPKALPLLSGFRDGRSYGFASRQNSYNATDNRSPKGLLVRLTVKLIYWGGRRPPSRRRLCEFRPDRFARRSLTIGSYDNQKIDINRNNPCEKSPKSFLMGLIEIYNSSHNLILEGREGGCNNLN